MKAINTSMNLRRKRLIQYLLNKNSILSLLLHLNSNRRNLKKWIFKTLLKI
jgi:hypothetical protein